MLQEIPKKLSTQAGIRCHLIPGTNRDAIGCQQNEFGGVFRKSLGGGQRKTTAHAEAQHSEAIDLVLMQKSLNDFLKPLFGQHIVRNRSGLGAVKKKIESIHRKLPFQLLRQRFEGPVILTNSVESQ